MEHEFLFKNIQSKVQISPEDYESFETLFVRKNVEKNQLIVEEGKRNDKLYIIENGLAYFYKTLENGSIQVIQFAKENYWVTDLSSFFSTTTALFSIKAIEDCTMLCITRKQYDEICLQNRSISTFFRLNLQNAYSNTLQRLSDVYAVDAENKYRYFVNNFYDINQRVPQYLVASYLGILPSSLSRIRNRTVKK